ncbi:MAG: conserved membrane protein of unknown function [Promethearchaeota archaeon]|nr:MAG: conserved membrane protein of unknown function [Candidatus Lokiarchaeota archaeon]
MFQLDIVRFIQIFVIQGFFSIFYFFMSAKILKRDTKKLNIILSLFYITVATAVAVNMIYAFMTSELIVHLLHFTTYFLFAYGQVFLLLFVLILIKSENVISSKIQLTVLGIYAALLIVLLFIPGGITINENTNWKPVWSIPFSIYAAIVSTVFTTIPTIYYSFQIYHKFENVQLKRKWIYFNTGLIAYFFVNYGTLVSNTLNDPTFRTVWLVLSAFTLPTTLLLYYGIGRSLT